MPLVAFVLLLIVLLLMLGFVCLCISDHPSQAVERVLLAIAHAPPAMVTAFVFVAMSFATVTPRRVVAATGRASPASLQRFLF
jgi:uncharacterized membrane protein YbhN (UPF0104 family)